MQLEHSFTVAAGIDEAWQALTDLGFVAARVPGAKVTSAAPERVDGSLKVKLGPLNLNYKGSVSLVDRDDAEHRATLRASGTDARNGTATSTTLARAVADGAATLVTLETELELTGKPAQFSTTIMHEVGVRLVSQFQTNLAAGLAAEGSTERSSSTQGAAAKEQDQPRTPEIPDETPSPAREADIDSSGSEPAAVPDEPATVPDESGGTSPVGAAGPTGTADAAASEEAAAPVTERAVSSTISPIRPDAVARPGGAAVSLAHRARPLVVRGLAPVALAAVVAAIAVSRRRAG